MAHRLSFSSNFHATAGVATTGTSGRVLGIEWCVADACVGSRGTPYNACMPKRHGVFMSSTLEDIQVKHKDVVFFVYRRIGRRISKFGELRVSQGAVVWRGRRDQKGRKLNWGQFERLMQERGLRSERRRRADRVSVPASRRSP